MHRHKILSSSRGSRADIAVLISLIVVGIVFVASGVISTTNIRNMYRLSGEVAETHEILFTLSETLSSMKDAETGQRGYILTGDEAYLTPYKDAVLSVESHLERLQYLTKDRADQNARLLPLRYRISARMSEIERTLQVRREQGLDAAIEVVRTNRGRVDMDNIRAQVTTILADEQQTRKERIVHMTNAREAAVISVIVAAMSGLLLTLIIALLVRRASLIRNQQEWLQSGEVGLGQAMLGEQRLDILGRNILNYLCEYTGAHTATLYTREGMIFNLLATHGVPGDHAIVQSFAQGDGLPGQVAASAAPVVLKNAEPDAARTLQIGTSFGVWLPRHLIIAPATIDGIVDAVIELGFTKDMPDTIRSLLERTSNPVAMALRAAQYRSSLQNLLEETQRQSEELQTQSEELRVNNEELEEQSRVLKESQLRLEQQQAELEQSNNQLSEQTRQLEIQRDDLARSEEEPTQKAEELQQASRYKSDFLANMSHELRTPLNSSLILAKLLADNRDGNLTEEQVRFATTIQSSGNDLLMLINDILDLSKIEAGQMEVRPEAIALRRLTSDMQRNFEMVAKEKGLNFHIEVAEGLSETIETDRMRLEQVLKNLMSNAFKFTEKGSVTFKITQAGEGHLAFAVSDTGIGISDDQQSAIFDAFRQADGTISRKYGGTGLGLSISRELARLLGGTIELESQVGEGSTFTLTLPLTLEGTDAQSPATPSAPAVAPKPASQTAKPAKAPVKSLPAMVIDPEAARPSVEDDRDNLNADDRVILVVEDDHSFARILYDLAHEQGFKCLIVHTAEDALNVARQYMPQALVLDIGLPDHSGLSVLDRLKRDPRTRHIPVHVVSADDYAHTALSLGAIGYMLKPVKREELVEAFKLLEGRLTTGVRRILVVEDDAVQRDSVMQLLKSSDVETVAAATAAECLDRLREETFDCMVLDLSLPDQSGYSLLETLSRESAYAFPPVIVYTGRDLSSDDEQKLRRYSKSIIIKGAKSPERLLDEVTLFLHKLVSELSPEQQKLIRAAKNRDAMLEGRRLLVVEDDVRNVYAITNIFEPLGAKIEIARNGREALEALEKLQSDPQSAIDLVLMDVMMPEMDGLTATREIRKRREWKKLPIIMLTAKAMKDDQDRCIDAGANDYMAKPIDVEKLVSLVRVWMPR